MAFFNRGKWNGRVLAGVLIASLVVLTLWIWQRGVAAQPTEQKTVVVTVGDIERQVRTTGTLVPVLKVDVGAQVTGQVRKLFVELGQQVEKGEQVALIDPTLALQDLRQQEALLEQQTAQLAAKSIDLKAAERELARQMALTAGEATSLAEREAAQDAVQKLKAEIRGNSALLQQSRILIDSAKAKLAYTRITAPVSGQVIAIAVQEGQTVNAVQQAPTLLTIAQMEKMTVRARVPEADITRVRRGQPVYFTTLGNDKVRHTGTVRAVQPAPEKINTALFYNALFEVPNPGAVLWPDMTVQVVFVTEARRQVATIPSALLGPIGEDRKATVRVLGQDGKSVPRTVTVGIDDGSRAEITAGLRVGERVLEVPALSGG
ncbi:efflux RND transporter periplasmic adaptor subunit [Massilia sp. CF038]|uniref:efflux RND transporter periplasmic adaptor subunit n=1 Tax=Massilia sp. CF038 TaxID=1881045 RepID=UPI00091016D6|nr:efflux RND transporter periplasmic adaptor subunit [Massilia sp. CF038]SHH62740.1 membrane fusion protein, macrolide-specific efflux system [Massilia sp. CF038]